MDRRTVDSGNLKFGPRPRGNSHPHHGECHLRERGPSIFVPRAHRTHRSRHADAAGAAAVSCHSLTPSGIPASVPALTRQLPQPQRHHLTEGRSSTVPRESLGLIETRGYVAAVEAADAMCKAARVRLSRMEITRDALVTVVVRGSLADVEAAVAAGARSAGRVGELLRQHVIPAPDRDLDSTLLSSDLTAASTDSE